MLFYILCVIGLLSIIVDQGSLRISVTAFEITVKNGFLFWRKEISYDEIVDIIFKNGPRLQAIPVDDKRTYGDMGQRFVINTHDDDAYIIQSQYAQEVLDAIRKANPRIKID